MATELSTSLYDFIHTKENTDMKDYVSTPDEICQFFSASTTFLLHQLRSKYPGSDASNESSKLWVGNSFILLKNVNVYLDQLKNEMTKDNLSLEQILPLPQKEIHLFKKLSRRWSKNYKKLNSKIKNQKRTGSQYSLQSKKSLTKISNKKSKINIFNALSRRFKPKKSNSKPKESPECVESAEDIQEPICLLSNRQIAANFLACRYSTTLSIAESRLLSNTITLKISNVKRCSSKLSVCDEDFCDSSDEI